MKDEPQIFRPNKVKVFALFLLSSMFVALSVFIIDENPTMSWISIIFFGLGIVISLIQFYPNSTYLKLTYEGFEVKSLFRSSFTRWTDIKDLEERSFRGNKMIFFDYTEKHEKYKKGNKLAKFLSVKEGSIQSIYDIKTKDLLDLMKYYKLKKETPQ